MWKTVKSCKLMTWESSMYIKKLQQNLLSQFINNENIKVITYV